MKRKISVLMVIFLLLNLLPIMSLPTVKAVDYETMDDFESCMAGPLTQSQVPGWTWDGTVVNVNVINEQSNNYVEVSNINTTGNNILVRQLSNPLSGKVVIEYRVRVNDTQYHQIPSVSGTGNAGTEVTPVLLTSSGGKLMVNNDSSKQYTFNSNTWYRMKLIIDTDNDTVDVYQDGVLLIAQKSLMTGVSDITRLKFKVKALLTSTLDFDDVKVSLYQEPQPDDNYEHFFLRAGSFANDMGTWKISSYNGSFDNVVLAGATDTYPEQTEPAVTTINVNTPGTYKIWVRSRDFPTNQPGSRYFNLKVGTDYNHIFGKHNKNGFAWEDGGSVVLPAGKVTVELDDTSAFFARVDSIFITNNLSLIPPENYEQMLSIANVLTAENTSPFAERLEYPQWAKTDAAPTQEHTIANDRIRVRFYEVPSSQGNVIQKSTEIKQNGNWVKVGDRLDEFGYLVMYADSSSITDYYFYGCPVWDQTVNYEGSPTSIKTADIFRSGIPSWIIPTSIEQGSDGNTIVLNGENEYAKLTVTWSVTDSEMEPTVNCSLEAKKNGSYSLGMFNGPETSLSNVDYLLAPLQFVSKFLPPISTLVSEVTSTNASSIMTLKSDNTVNAGSKLTYGITVDPSSIPYRWAYKDNQKFGLGIKGINGGVQPYLFAPMFGMDDSIFTEGQTYEITYRPTVSLDGWYDTYNHVVNDIFQVKDMRKNNYTSVTDTIFNLQKLMMNDQYSGWSSKAMGFANMEIKNQFKQPVPLEMIQNYLLTEDRDYYVKRAIPTLAYLLTRSNEGFAMPGSTETVAEIGNPTKLYGSGIFAGLYYMSRGQIPAFARIGITDSIRSSGTSQIPGWMEKLYRYKFTGNTDLLAAAKQDADTYIQNKVYGGRYYDPNGGFYALDAYPYVTALLDLYEVTREQKYLDAAVESARQLLTSTWTQPLVPDENIQIDADWIRDRGFWSDNHSNGTYFWNGLTRYRLGNNEPYPEGYNGINGITDNIDSLESESVPAWLTSRTGWSVEGTSSYFVQDSANVTMTNWAADLLRIAKYTGDSLFETTARNGIIGRAANYPGYYITKDMTYYMQEDYPYTGPDITNIYYHHIPVYMGMLQDFLITQAWKWSDAKINFPSMRQYGYVWFDNKVYGFAPGSFFDEDNMWLWLKEGLITVDNKQIDWVGARKDGTFAAALMNEDSNDVEVTVTLGDEITGQQDYNGDAVVYNDMGDKTTVPVINGKMTITVSSKKLVGFSIKSDAVKAPAFAQTNMQEAFSGELGETVAETTGSDDFGKGYVLQIDPNSYFAYVYVPYTPDKVSRAVLHYKIGDDVWKSEEITEYPFEFIKEVSDINDAFSYYVEITDTSGVVKTSVPKWLRAKSDVPTVNVTEISLDKTQVILKNAASASLAASVLPENATNKAVIWSSSDPLVATVDDNGTVTGQGEGTAIITASTVEGSRTTTCSISVDNTLPEFSLQVNGNAINEGDVFDDCLPLTFKAWDNLSGLASARITIDGADYSIDTTTQSGIDIDLAGRVGDYTAVITVEDVAGNINEKTFSFTVTTRIDSMRHLIERYTAAGEINDPLIFQLTNNLDQAQHQLDKERSEQAIKHMESFIKHLDNIALENNITDNVKFVLKADAQALIQIWS